MTAEEIKNVLERHKHWVKRDCDGWKDMKANLSGANLFEADLSGADLYKADFSKTTLYRTIFDPVGQGFRKGRMLRNPMVGYKKCINDIIVTLEIPAGAIVFGINDSKLRTNRAKVIAIDGAERAFSGFKYFSYYVGDEITVWDFNCIYNIECEKGIHFFRTREEA